MEKPRENNRQSFSDLVRQKAIELGFKAQDFMELARIAPSTFEQIQNNRMPDFEHKDEITKVRWIKSIVRLCQLLKLEVKSCLKACGLPFDKTTIEKGSAPTKSAKIGEEFTEQDLLALLKVVQESGEPITLLAALDHIRKLHAKKQEAVDLR